MGFPGIARQRKHEHPQAHTKQGNSSRINLKRSGDRALEITSCFFCLNESGQRLDASLQDIVGEVRLGEKRLSKGDQMGAPGPCLQKPGCARACMTCVRSSEIT